jgi:hypothetical protein
VASIKEEGSIREVEPPEAEADQEDHKEDSIKDLPPMSYPMPPLSIKLKITSYANVPISVASLNSTEESISRTRLR